MVAEPAAWPHIIHSLQRHVNSYAACPVDRLLFLVYDPAMKTVDGAAEQVEKVSRALQRHIKDQGLSYRDVEDRLEMGRDYLSQLLRGSVDIKLKHVMGVLLSTERPPAEFFATVYELLSPEKGARLEFEKDLATVERTVVRDLIWTFRKKGLLSEDEATVFLGRLDHERPQR